MNIPYGRQSISDDDIAAVVAVLKSDWLTQGPAVERFEQSVAAYCGAQHAVAVCNATAALHLACMALDLGEGGRLWTSPNTFVASANCARYCGAMVDFVDIDPQTYNMSVPALAEKLAAAEKNGTLPKIVVPVHFGGQSCDMAGIAELASRYGFNVIEDASHAIGGDYLDGKVGSCRYSDFTVFSFHPVKVMTTGEGGMLMTNQDALANRANRLRSHGITRNAAEMTGPPEGGWYYQQTALGFNYRMTDLQSALGSSQLDRLDRFVARRRQLAARYDALLQSFPVIRPFQADWGKSAFHLYPIQIDAQRTDRGRDVVFQGLRDRGIGVNVHYIPVHLQPYYRDLGFAVGDFPEAERYYRHAITLPLYYDLGDAEQDRVLDALKAALS